MVDVSDLKSADREIVPVRIRFRVLKPCGVMVSTRDFDSRGSSSNLLMVVSAHVVELADTIDSKFIAKA